MNQLEKIRKSKKLSREKLCALSGVPDRAIKAYESGQVDLAKASYSYVIKLAQALEVEPQDFFAEDSL